MTDEKGRGVVRLWCLKSPEADYTGTWIFKLPTDEDGVTRDKAFYGCSTRGDCRGRFENCTWNGKPIPDGTLSLKEWLGA